jgi:hypothetical protein
MPKTVRAQIQRWWLPHEQPITWRASLLTVLALLINNAIPNRKYPASPD